MAASLRTTADIAVCAVIRELRTYHADLLSYVRAYVYALTTETRSLASKSPEFMSMT